MLNGGSWRGLRMVGLPTARRTMFSACRLAGKAHRSHLEDSTQSPGSRDDHETIIERIGHCRTEPRYFGPPGGKRPSRGDKLVRAPPRNDQQLLGRQVDPDRRAICARLGADCGRALCHRGGSALAYVRTCCKWHLSREIGAQVAVVHASAMIAQQASVDTLSERRGRNNA